jgi:hypothetical protein
VHEGPQIAHELILTRLGPVKREQPTAHRLRTRRQLDRQPRTLGAEPLLRLSLFRIPAFSSAAEAEQPACADAGEPPLKHRVQDHQRHQRVGHDAQRHLPWVEPVGDAEQHAEHVRGDDEPYVGVCAGQTYSADDRDRERLA